MTTKTISNFFASDKLLNPTGHPAELHLLVKCCEFATFFQDKVSEISKNNFTYHHYTTVGTMHNFSTAISNALEEVIQNLRHRMTKTLQLNNNNTDILVVDAKPTLLSQ